MKFLKELRCMFFHTRHHFFSSFFGAPITLCQICDAELLDVLIKIDKERLDGR
jgi:hypothetical protein